MKIAFFLIPFIMGVAFLVVGIHSVKQGLSSKHWPSVEGEIIKSQIRKVKKHRKPGSGMKYGVELENGVKVGLGKKDRYNYRFDIEYRYQVDGDTYTGNRVSFGGEDTINRQDEAREMADKYASGAKVKVYYNPEKLKQSILQPGVQRNGLWIFAGAAGLFLAAFIVPRFVD